MATGVLYGLEKILHGSKAMAEYLGFSGEVDTLISEIKKHFTASGDVQVISVHQFEGETDLVLVEAKTPEALEELKKHFPEACFGEYL